MTQQLTVVYTALVTVPGTVAMVEEIMPDVRLVNIVDDSLLPDVMAAGGVTKSVTRRLCDLFRVAQETGADLILNQCSSVAEIVDVAQNMIDVPILKIDQAMAEEAVRQGPRVAVVATVPTTLGPTSRLIERCAVEMGQPVKTRQLLAEGAFDKISSGDVEGHNRMVLNKILEVRDEVDVVVLAQGSMAAVVPALEANGILALTSPRLGVERAKEMLDAMKA